MKTTIQIVVCWQKRPCLWKSSCSCLNARACACRERQKRQRERVQEIKLFSAKAEAAATESVYLIAESWCRSFLSAGRNNYLPEETLAPFSISSLSLFFFFLFLSRASDVCASFCVRAFLDVDIIMCARYINIYTHYVFLFCLCSSNRWASSWRSSLWHSEQTYVFVCVFVSVCVFQWCLSVCPVCTSSVCVKCPLVLDVRP